MLSKNDFKVLISIYEYGCTNEMKSVTIKKIIELTGLSYGKIRISMDMFRSLEYIREGLVNHNAKTYYVTSYGIEKINNLMKE